MGFIWWVGCVLHWEGKKRSVSSDLLLINKRFKFPKDCLTLSSNQMKQWVLNFHIYDCFFELLDEFSHFLSSLEWTNSFFVTRVLPPTGGPEAIESSTTWSTSGIEVVTIGLDWAIYYTWSRGLANTLQLQWLLISKWVLKICLRSFRFEF